MKTLNLIKRAAAALATITALSMMAPAPAKAMILYKADLEPLTYNLGNGSDWVTQNGSTYRKISIRNNGNLGAPASLALVRFVNAQQYVDTYVVVPPVPAGQIVTVLVSAPFTNLGPGIGLAVKADAYNNMVNESNEYNNECYLYFYTAPSNGPVISANPHIVVKP